MKSAGILILVLMTSVCASPISRNDRELLSTVQTTVPPSYNGILHQLGEYFKGRRDLSRRQLTVGTGEVTLSQRNDILHELGEYWKGRLAPLMSHSFQQHINLFSQLFGDSK
uniref:Uncharacterized protein LOC111101454 n=1 Tax=Crassostrea virginica TaxID=6565 RepID=A0A8B8AGK2_CRAVI|nr:uncharacterized protein LOC111101454 [Crassostrea virginica]